MGCPGWASPFSLSRFRRRLDRRRLRIRPAQIPDDRRQLGPQHRLRLDLVQRLDLQVIRPRGTIAIYANNGGDEVTLSVRETFSTNARFQWVLLYTVGQAALRAAAEDITAALEDGAFNVGEGHGLPVHHFPLERTTDAHAAVESGAVGKVLLDVADA